MYGRNQLEDVAVQRAIEVAVAETGARRGDVEGFYMAGGDWDAETSEELADLIVTCWREQEAAY
jgi:hypothetical protein